MATLECVVVTPEKTELRTSAESIVVPLYDGLLGILPGRAPMIGRLGFGLMKLKQGSNESSYFVDGGFVQVTRDATYVLTDRLLQPSEIKLGDSEQELQDALLLPNTNPDQASFRERAISRARAKCHVAAR